VAPGVRTTSDRRQKVEDSKPVATHQSDFVADNIDWNGQLKLKDGCGKTRNDS
jgi:hypothetical protein